MTEDARASATRAAATSTASTTTSESLGLPGLVAQGTQVTGPAYGLLLDAWGEDFLAHGSLDVQLRRHDPRRRHRHRDRRRRRSADATIEVVNGDAATVVVGTAPPVRRVRASWYRRCAIAYGDERRYHGTRAAAEGSAALARGDRLVVRSWSPSSSPLSWSLRRRGACVAVGRGGRLGRDRLRRGGDARRRAGRGVQREAAGEAGHRDRRSRAASTPARAAVPDATARRARPLRAAAFSARDPLGRGRRRR